jgi:O-antigen/teichoic acid export membrane protein
MIAALAPIVAGDVLRIPTALRGETVTAFRLLAIAIPFTVTTAGLRGVLEATQSFGVINLLRLPLALATFAGPMLVIPFAPTLTAAVTVLVVGRGLVLVAHVVALRRVQRTLGTVHRPRLRHLRPLVTLGGWITVSNVVSPLMSSLDRFVVGAVLSVQAVAYYATSYEAVTRLWTITAVLLPVLFPAIAATADTATERAGVLIDRGMRASLVAAFPAAFVLGVFAPEWLAVWVGRGFAEHAAPLARILAAAVLVNVAGQVAYTAVQAAGRAEATGRLHLAELAPYAAALWLLLHTAGATGVAWAWGARVAVDTAVLLYLARKYVPSCGHAMRHGGRLVALGASLVLASVWLPGLAWRVLYASIVLTVFGVYVWGRYLAPEERAMLRALTMRWRRASPSGEAA